MSGARAERAGSGFLVGDTVRKNTMMAGHSMTLNERRFYLVWVVAAILLGGVLAQAQTIGFVPGNPSVNENGTNVTLVVTRSPATGLARVSYAARDLTATAGLDYTAVSGTLTFTNGETFKTIVVPIVEDASVEAHETFEVNLFNVVGGVLARTNVAVTIYDNDTLISFTSPNYSVNESDPNAVITLARSGGNAGAASVLVATRSGTAVVGSDFVQTATTVLFTNGQTFGTFLVPLIDDCVLEGAESFTVFLTNAFGASIGAVSNATVTIIDNDSLAGTLIIRSVSRALAPEGSLVTVTIGRLCSALGAVTVDLVPLNSTNNSSSNALLGVGLDYTFASTNGTVSWATNDLTDKVIVLDLLADGLVELNEVILLGLTNATGGALINPNASTVAITIDFNDQPAGAADLIHNPITAFNPTPGANNTVRAVAVNSVVGDPNFGTAVIAGDFTAVNGVVRNRLARLDVTGFLDPTFAPLDGADGSVASVVIQPDGRILVAGGFAAINGLPRNGVARLLDTGLPDVSFDPGLGLNGTVAAMALQPDGRVVVVGDFTTAGGEVRRQVARFNTNGSVDLTFDARLGSDGSLLAVAIVPGAGGAPSRILVGGAFSSFNGVAANGIVRLNTDGSVDGTFAPVAGIDGIVFAIAVQANGASLLGGSFNAFDGASRRSIVRVNPNGTLDATFDPGAAVEGSVFDIAIQANGGILIAGQFSAFDGVVRNNLARLNADGTLDTSFLDSYYNQTQQGPNGLVLSVALQPDTNVVVGGSFDTVGGGPSASDVLQRQNVARLLGGNPPPPLNRPGNVEFVAASFSVNENAAGGVVIVTARRTGGNLLPLVVDYATSDRTAVAGVDYQAVTGTLSWNDQESLATNKTFAIPILNNALVDGNRTFEVILANPRSGTQPPTTQPAPGFQRRAVVTIIDDDFTVGVFGFAGPVFEVSEAVGNATITIERANGSTGVASVQYATVPGTATTGVDYLSRSGTLTFISGQTKGTFTVPIINDVAPEFEESIQLTLSNPTGGATLGLANAVLLIMDNDSGPGSFGSLSFTTNNFSVSETNRSASIVVRRTSGGVGQVEVDVQSGDFLPVAPGRARANLDYTPVTRHLIFPAGSTNSQTVSIPILADRLVEGTEVFTVWLTNVTGGARLGYLSNATVAIVDANTYGQLTFSAASYFISENGGTSSIRIDRVGGDAEQVAVEYLIVPGTAISNVDFVAASGTLIFEDGQTSTNLLIPIIDNLLVEPNRTLSLILSNFNKATPGRFTNATLTLFDDESLAAPAGAVNTGFDTTVGANAPINALLLAAGGKLVIAGQFTGYGGTAINRIARLNPDGRLDVEFQPGTGANGEITALALQADQKLVAGGRFTAFNGANRSYLARLNAEGSLDSTFNIGSGPDNPVFAVAVRNDGRLAVGGSFTTFNGIGRANFLVLTTNGVVDPSFNVGAGVNGQVFAVAVQPDGRVLIGGDFTLVNNTNRARLARFNANGTLDLSFDPGTNGANATVRVITVQPDGKVLVGGSFTNISGTNWNHLARLNADGTPDRFFNPGTGANEDVLALALLPAPDNRILVGGSFTNFNTLGRHYLTRLTTNGAVDSTMNFGLGANAPVFALALQADQQLNAAGAFTQFDGVPRNRLVRLLGGDNFGPGEFEFSAADFTVSENATNATLVVRRVGGSQGAATLTFATANGTATNGVDYTATSGPLVFRDAELFRTIQVPVTNNLTSDGDRTFTVTLGSTGGAVLGRPTVATVTILDDDTILNFSSPTFSVIENVPGARAFITVERLGGSAGSVSVQYLTSTGGTAIPYPGAGPVGNANYTNAAGVLTWANGETGGKTFAIGIIDDLLTNANRTINLALFGATNGTARTPITLTGQTNATLTLVDNEFGRGLVGFSQPTFDVSESIAVATITVIRTNGSAGVVTVDFSTSDGSALAGVNYVATSGTLSFADSEQAKTFPLTILSDGLSTTNLSFSVTVSNPTGGAGLGFQDSAVVLILNDDQLVFGGLVFSATNYVVSEAVGEAILEVQRLGGTSNAVAVFYTTTTNGTATTNDYGPASGNLFWADRDGSSRFIRVPVTDNNFADADRTVEVVLLNAVGGASIGTPGSTFITITNDDFLAGTLGFGEVVFNVTENATNAVITVTRTNGTLGIVGASFATLDVTAVAGRDYVATNGFLVFTNGATNATFSVPLINNALQDGPRFLAVQLFGLAGGAQPGLTGALVRIGDDEGAAGSVDASYLLGSGFNGTVYALAVTTNNLAYVGGDFTTFNGTNRPPLVRLNADGTFDAGFNVGAIIRPGTNAAVRAVALAGSNGVADGRVVFGGVFTSVGGVARTNVARLNANGTLDTNFVANVNNLVNAAAVQNDGRVVLGGQFTVVNGLTRNFVARLNLDGTLDAGFATGLGPNGAVRALVLQPDGKTIIGGEFTAVNGVSASRLARLNADGSLDGSFSGGRWLTNGAVYALALQRDGRLLVGGAFVATNGVVHTNLVRLTAGGVIEDGYNPFVERNDYVSALALQGNGRAVVGGAFTTFNGLSENRIVRLTTNGTVDVSINFGAGADDYVAALAVQPDGRLLAGGAFTNFNGTTANHFVRLFGGENLGSGVLAFATPVFLVAESGTNAVITVLRSGGLANPVTASFTTTNNGTAVAGVDYVATNGVLNFAPGVAAASFLVPVLNDSTIRGDRTVGLALTGVTGGAAFEVPPAAVLAILEDDSLISFASATYSVGESTTNALITLVRSGGAVGPATVTFATTTNGTAVAGVNYVPTSQVVLFPPGTNSVTVAVGVLDDGLIVGNLTVGLTLTNAGPTNFVALGEVTNATLTMVESLNAAGVLNFASTNFVVDEAVGSAVITVVRSGGSLGLVTVQYATGDGTALAGLDYGSVTGVVSFADGEMAKSFLVPVILDQVVETNEFLNLTLFNPNGGAVLGAAGRAVLTIVNNNLLVFGNLAFSATNYVVSEAVGEAVLTVRRLGGTTNAVSVFYTTTTNGTAAATDFAATNGLLSWAHLQGGDRFIRVPIFNNPFADGDRTVEVELSTATGGADIAPPGRTLITITNDDLTNPGALGFSQLIVGTSETNGTVLVEVVRTNGSFGIVSASFTTADASARAGIDYVATSSVLTFTNGQTTQTFSVMLLDNAIQDGARFFGVRLTGFTGGATGGLTNASVRIADDEGTAGSVDLSYLLGSGFNGTVYTLAVTTNNLAYVGGDFTAFNGSNRAGLVRLLPDGLLDGGFDLGAVGFTGSNASVRSVAEYPPNGFTASQVVFGGVFNSVGGVGRTNVARVNPNGSVDPSFVAGTDNLVNAVLVQPDGRVVLGGLFTRVNGSSRNFVARLNFNGSLDADFLTGTGPDGAVRALALQPDGKLIIAGEFTTYAGVPASRIARLNPDGTLDPTFAGGSWVASGSVQALLRQPDGRILVGGAFVATNGVAHTNLMRLNGDGTVDASFNPGTGPNEFVGALALQRDGRIVAGGAFTMVNGLPENRIVRLQPDGSVDYSINFGGGANDYLAAVAVQPDGDLLVGGAFTNFNGVAVNHYARLTGGQNRGAGLLQFGAAGYPVAENGTNAVLTVVRTGGLSNVVTVTYATTANGTAAAGVDYQAVSGVLTLAPGVMTTNILVPVIDNRSVTSNRTVEVALSGVTGGATLPVPTTTLVTILEDDSAINFVSANYSVGENATNAVITLTRSGGLVGAVSVNLATTTNGTAVAGVNYQPTNLVVNFPAGTNVVTVAVGVLDDGLVLGNLTVGLVLSNAVPTNFVALGTVTNATLTIVESRNAAGVLNFASANFVVDETVGNAVITVVRSAGSLGSISVQYATADGSALAGLDFTGVGGVLSFADGETAKSFVVPVILDALLEPNEFLNLSLTNPGGGALLGATNRAVVTIVNNNQLIFGTLVFTATNYVVGEAAGEVILEVQRIGGRTNGIAVFYTTTTNGTATTNDYGPVSGNLLWGNLDGSSRFIRVAITNNNLADADRTVEVVLRNVVGGAAIGTPGSTFITITNDDFLAGALGFEQLVFVVTENATNALITVVRTNGVNGIVGVSFATVDGTAVNGLDYLATNGFLVFTNGATNQTFSVPVLNNTLQDGTRFFGVRLSGFVGGAVPGLTNSLVRIGDDEGPAGSVDALYALGTGFNGTVYSLAVTTNSQAYVAGDFTVFNGSNRAGLVRLNADGALDAGFDVGALGFTGSNASVRSVALVITNGFFTGKAVFGGLFTSVGGAARTNVARVNTDGTPDTSFVANVNNLVNAVAVQNDGRVVLGGLFTRVNGTNRNFIARLNSDGSLDAGFSRGLGPNGAVRTLVLQPDGRAIIGGEFTTVDGFASSRLARLNPDGSFDSTFRGGDWITNGAVYTLALQRDGRLLVGGAFVATNGVAHTNLVRLDANGVLDGGFNPFVARNDYVSALAVQPDGRVVVGGAFTTFNGLPENRIVRLEATGVVDVTCNFGSGANDYIAALALQFDGRILAGGAFTNFNGTTANHFVRLHGGENLGAGVLAFSAPVYAVEESGTNAVITVVRAGGLSGQVTVGYATTTSGTAVVGVDYRATNGVLSFATGVTARSFLVPVLNDFANRGDRTVGLALSSVTGGAALEVPPTAVLTILDDDSLISFASATFSVGEGTTNALITLVRSGGLVGAVSVNFATTTNGTAVAGVNYQPTTRVVTFPAGTNEVTVTVGVLDDGLVLGNLTVGLALSNAVPTNFVALGVLTNATLTIVESLNSAGALNFASANFMVDEAVGDAVITLVRSGGSLGLVSVQYSTADGSALAALDYTSASGVISFADGETVKSFLVPVILDTLVETNEFANLVLSNPSGGAVLGATNRSVLTIINNNQLSFGSLVFLTTNFVVSEAAGSAVVEVRRIGGLTNAITVFWATASGNTPTTNETAATAADYTSASGILSWGNLDGAAKFITNQVINNLLVDGNRSYELVLANVTGGASIGTPGRTFVTITNEDALPGALGFAQMVFAAVENGTNATVTVVRTNGSTGTVSVSFNTADATALAGRDYAATNGALTFTNGQTTQTFAVPLFDNAVLDGSRFFQVRLSGFTGGAVPGLANALVRIADDEGAAGSIDSSYTNGLGPDAIVYSLGLQGNGQLIIGGEFNSFDGITRSRVARVNDDGTLDQSFDAGAVSFASGVASIRAVAPHTNGFYAGQVVVAGFFNSVGGRALSHVARLDVNGVVDASFTNSLTGPNNGVYAVAVQADGRAVIGGTFTTVNTTNRSFVARLTATGGVDPSFDPQVGPDGPVRAVAIQNDGKVIIGGDFSSVNSLTNRNHLARLNADGSLDASFVPFGLSITGSVYSVAIQTDGKVLVGGQFLAAGGAQLQTNMGGVVRLHADGSLDTTFFAGTGADDSVSAVAVQPDGKVLLGGSFVNVNGIGRSRLARLNADGSLDASFNVGLGANNLVTSLAVQGDGKILLGGAFTRFNGATNNYLARLFGGDNLGSGTLAFSASLYQVSESASNAVLTVTRSGGTFGQVTVALTIPSGAAGGTAIPNINYVPLTTNILVFAEGQATAEFAIRLLDDHVILPDRTIVLNLANAGGGAVLDAVTDTTVLLREKDCLVSFGAAVYSVAENVGNAVITVARTGGVVENLTVDVSTGTNGTAFAGTDFTVVLTTVTFASGQSNATFTVAITDDGLIEGNETIPLSLSIPAAFGSFASPGQFTNAALVIIDNDGGSGTLGFATNAFSVLETGGFATVTVARSLGRSGAVSVDYATVAVPNGASGGVVGGPNVDFVITQGTLAFADGEIVKTFTVPVFADQLIEGNEPVSLTLTNTTGGAVLGLAAATLTIVDDVVFAGRFEFTADTFRVGEGETNAVITVRRTGLNAGRATVSFSVTDITAVAGLDYLVTNGSLVFPDAGPGNVPTVQTTNFLVPIIDDSLLEVDEQVRVTLSNPSLGSALGALPTAVLTIVDNDVVIAFSTNRFAVDEDAGDGHLLVVRTGNTNSAVTFQVATRDGSGTNGIDYTGFTNAFAFGPGEIFRDIPVPVIGNTLVNGSRTVNLRLLNPFPTNSVQLGLTNTAVLNILDNDSGFLFSTASFSVGEAAGSAVITVLRTGTNSQEVTVTYATADGTAVSPADYQATNGVLRFASGDTAKSFSVVIRDDALPESDETFSVLLSDPTPTNSAFLGALSTATVTIQDNDAQVGFALANYAVSEAAGTAGISLVRLGATNRAVSVNVSTGVGTATAGADYVATNGVVVFGPGMLTNVFNVTVVLDNVVEGSETLPLVLSLPSVGVTLGPITTATLTISDNAGTFAFTAAAYTVLEDGTNAVLTVVRTSGAAGTVNVDYRTVDGTAIGGSDYVGAGGTLVFAPGVLASFIVVPIIDDRLIEATETFTVTLRISDPTTGAKLGAFSNATVSILDNDTPSGNDFRFDPTTWITNGSVFSVVAQPDGKLLVGGSFRVVVTNVVVVGGVLVTNYPVMNNIARLNSDGSLDATFTPGAGPNDAVRSMVLQADGKVLIGGDFTYVAQPGYIRNHVARLNADGSLDTSFTPNTGAGGPVIVVARQPDGKVLIGGMFSMVITNVVVSNSVAITNRYALTNIARLNSSGSLDTSFGAANGTNRFLAAADQSVFDIAVQPDGKIVIAGAFTRYNGTNRNYLARLNADGSLDPNFNPGTVLDGAALGLAIQPFDGKIIVVGVFGQSLPPSPFPITNLAVRSFVARFQTNGALDTGFAPSIDGSVLTVALQPNGQIIVAGDFSRVTGVPRSRIARLTPDGLVDLAFDPGAGADGIVYSVTFGLNGKVFLGGDFTHFDGVPRNHVARLNGTPNVAALAPLNAARTGPFQLNLQGLPLGNYRIEASTDFVTWTVVATVTNNLNGQATFSDPSSPGMRRRFYRVVKL